MTLDYQDVVPEVLRVFVESRAWGAGVRALIVRTLHGAVRLVLDADHTRPEHISELEQSLVTALGPWFRGPVIAPNIVPEGLRRIARELWRGAEEAARKKPDWADRWPTGWPAEVPGALPGSPATPLVGRVEARQEALGKEPWVAPELGLAPWPMAPRAPRITAFHGFKGGAGRTTALGMLAWLVAARGERVVCVDLDLEAPGLSYFLPGDQPVQRGVIDFLLSHAATGQGGALPVQAVQIHGQELHVVAAGVVDDLYVEKLSRLDTLHGDTSRSPVHLALNELLERIRQDIKPQHIFIDCRAGLHDLAGLALNDLAHVNVFVGRGGVQEMGGLYALLRRHTSRRASDDQLLLFLRTFHPLPIEPDRLDRQRQALFELCTEVIKPYIPQYSDQGAAHDPAPLGYHDEVTRADHLGKIPMLAIQHPLVVEALARLEALWT